MFTVSSVGESNLGCFRSIYNSPKLPIQTHLFTWQEKLWWGRKKCAAGEISNLFSLMCCLSSGMPVRGNTQVLPAFLVLPSSTVIALEMLEGKHQPVLFIYYLWSCGPWFCLFQSAATVSASTTALQQQVPEVHYLICKEILLPALIITLTGFIECLLTLIWCKIFLFSS